MVCFCYRRSYRACYSILFLHKIFCMKQLDWIVLVVTLLVIIGYGLYKSRTSRNLDSYFLSNRSLPWGLVLLSIMGTQASAITFLAAPGQAYSDGIFIGPTCLWEACSSSIHLAVGQRQLLTHNNCSS